VNLEHILSQVNRPSRYCGNEFNVIKKDWGQVDLKMALLFPDLYEIGMSHQGLQILYHLINERADLLAERAYSPAPDMEEMLRSKGEKLFALESQRPLSDFDLLGITLPYELCYTNILTTLDLAGLPFRSKDRDERYPLVLGGGPGAFHPEPVADFFDAILLGDGEEAILEIADLLISSRKEGLERKAILHRLEAVAGVYVPSLFIPQYDSRDNFTGMVAKGNKTVSRRVLADIESTGAHTPLVPLARIVHDRLGIEIARGCTRGCRFCQAGIIYRPVRERSPECILKLAEKGISESGFDELALLSLSTGDYSCIPDLLVSLMNRMAGKRVSVSMPSMRVGTLTPEIMTQIKRVRKTGFTLAPEAGTDRLRRVINKGITEEDLLLASRSAFELGWKLLKFYFMFGLPTETAEDLAAIPELVRRALQGFEGGGARRINVSVATFVPKPHTPFQRAGQLSIDEGFERIDFLKNALRGKKFQLKWHDPRQSYMEGVMSRGDRRLSRVIEEAWRRGARLDAWSEHYRLSIWQEAAAECGIELDNYLRQREVDEPLPWDHLECGVDREFLEAENLRATTEDYTPDCRIHGCQKCGLCDFKTIRPVVYGDRQPLPEVAHSPDPEQTGKEEQRFIYRIDYSRTGPARFLGHLEVIQMFYRVLRKVEMPLNFSQGFNPTPRVSFSPALPLGTESLAEYLQVETGEPLKGLETVTAEISGLLPAGFSILEIRPDGGRVEQRLLNCYHIAPSCKVNKGSLVLFMEQDHYEVEVIRKGRLRKIDARPMVRELTLTNDETVELVMITESGSPGLKPLELIGKILSLSSHEVALSRVNKLWSHGIKD